MQNKQQKIVKFNKEFNPKEIGYSIKRKVTYQQILIKSVFAMPAGMMLHEFLIIQERDKLKMLITPFGIVAEEEELKKLTDMMIKSVQYN